MTLQYPRPGGADFTKHISRQKARASKGDFIAGPLSSPHPCPTPPPSRDSGYSSPGELAADSERLQRNPVCATTPSLLGGSCRKSLIAAGPQSSTVSKKSSFPVALVAALASLPFEQRNRSSTRSGRPQQNAASDNRTPQTIGPQASATEADEQSTAAPLPAPPSMPRPVQQQEEIASLPPGALQPDDVAHRSTAAAAAALAAAAAAAEEAAAAGGSAAPLDSWGSSFVSSDEESEQLAKQRVIELLSHPAETELLLLAEVEAQQKQQGSAGSGGLSVSPEYIDALVHAVQDPSVGEEQD